ncbi:hypothetical protein [Bizionia arctica]|uniref:Uncharacterized protein n=1 Tax=Bizionia arctica TaxID=1495645 RepID=A0A917GDY5_9FLAO|nr:hypothetical protein [Bizionia arctica]GGG40646.1 hypothetical protein GCM10010976_10330 [Bizionia arctica]
MTRNELYNLVWSKPVSQILKQYPIKITTFKKLCEDNVIPLPKNGYWSKIRFNKEVDIIPLPKSDKENIDISLSEKLKGLSELNLLIREIKNDKSLPLKVPENFTKTDKIIVRTKKYFSESAKIKYPKTIEEPKEGVFYISVSKLLERRAYLFADTLIKLVRARGHDVAVVTNHKYHNYNGTKLIIFGEYFNIRIREPDNRVMEKHDTYDWMQAKYYPSGKLTLNYDRRIYGKTWGDTETKFVEDRLPDILAFFEIRAKRIKKERIEREIWHKEYERKKKIEEELKAKRNQELKDFKSVINHSSRWQKAMDLRNYIQTVESNAIKNNKLTQELKDWLEWINDKADWYDPLIEKEDELFENVDRDTLESKSRFW